MYKKVKVEYGETDAEFKMNYLKAIIYQLSVGSLGSLLGGNSWRLSWVTGWGTGILV